MTQAAIDYNKLKSAPVHLDAYIKSIDSESKEGVVKLTNDTFATPLRI
jgi:hypothetical protein